MNTYMYKDIYVGQVEEFVFDITKEKMKQIRQCAKEYLERGK